VRRVREVILVEGRYDRNLLSQVVEATVFETRGFGIFKDRELRSLLRRAAALRGLIILTDSDGAGFLIRNHLKGILPPDQVKHAYIPAVPGKERRKKTPSREGLLGVEGMTPEVILGALTRAGAHFLDEEEITDSHPPITRQDLYALGLMGGEGSAALRDQVKAALELPPKLGTSGFLEALNLITDLPGLRRLLEQLTGREP